MGNNELLSDTDEVLVERAADRVAVVTLNRPRRLNALTRAMRRGVIDAIRALDHDSAIGAVVLTGAGNRAFAAGQDLDEAKDFDEATIDKWIDEWGELYESVLRSPKPVVAAINGYAVGAAFQLAMVCDLRIAAQSARFGMPEINDAIPCVTGTWSLYDVIGRGRTMELVLTGRTISAHEALAWGIVAQVVSDEALHESALRVAADLAAKPAGALQTDKRLFADLALQKWPAAAAFAKQGHRAAFTSGEPARRMTKFVSEGVRTESEAIR